MTLETLCSRRSNRWILTLFFSLIAAAPQSAAGGASVEVIPDQEIRCPYHAPSKGHHEVVYVDLSDGTLRAADLSNPTNAMTDLVTDRFFELGWSPGIAFFDPTWENAVAITPLPVPEPTSSAQLVVGMAFLVLAQIRRPASFTAARIHQPTFEKRMARQES